MQRDMDKIVFESRSEIEEVIRALENSAPFPSDTVQTLIDLLDVMHMEW